MEAAVDYARATAFLFAMLYGTAGILTALYYAGVGLRHMWCVWAGCCTRCGANLEEYEIFFDMKVCSECETKP